MLTDLLYSVTSVVIILLIIEFVRLRKDYALFSASLKDNLQATNQLIESSNEVLRVCKAMHDIFVEAADEVKHHTTE